MKTKAEMQEHIMDAANSDLSYFDSIGGFDIFNDAFLKILKRMNKPELKEMYDKACSYYPDDIEVEE